jgi:hypothetical protein
LWLIGILDAVVLNDYVRRALWLKFSIHAVDLLKVVILDRPIGPNRNRLDAFDAIAAIAKANALNPLLGVVEGVVFDGDAVRVAFKPHARTITAHVRGGGHNVDGC